MGLISSWVNKFKTTFGYSDIELYTKDENEAGKKLTDSASLNKLFEFPKFKYNVNDKIIDFVHFRKIFKD